MGMIVLDTTILAYATGGAHPLRDPCIRLLDRIRVRAVDASTTVEVIQEFAHVRARRRSRSDAGGLARSMTRLLAPLLAPTAAELVDGLELFEREQALGSFDSVLVGLCRSRNAALASADRGFSAVPG